jgi:dipeptidyl aminopeptidase/acylaminoacyl peptidase
MPSPILPKHANNLIDVSNPNLSPNGTSLIFTRTHVNTKDMKSISQTMHQALPNSDPEIFTQGQKDTRPQHAPNGKTIAFLRPDDKDKKQIHLISTTGGEAKQCTTLNTGINDFSWSPDSQQFVAVSRIDSDPPKEDNAYPKSQVVQRIRYRGDGEGWQGNTFLQLFVISVQTGEAKQITNNEGDHHSPTWSPDGKHIAFITDAIEDRDLNRRSEARIITPQGGNSQCWSNDLSRVDTLAWSPNSSQLAAVGSHDADIWDPRMSWLYILTPDKPAQHLTDGTFTIASLAHSSWTNDDHIIIVGDHAGESTLYRVPTKSGEATPITGGSQMFTALTVANTQVVVQTNSPTSPSDLVAIHLENGTPNQLTHFNREFLSQHPPATLEKFTFSRNNLNIQARVFFPSDFDESKKYPLILEIHGGPNGRFSDYFDITHQVLTGAGYIVLAVNPRGSSSYGPDFLKAVLCDWGGEDFLDLMAAVDEICKRPYVDANRLGVHGYSYGGFMSSWIVGHDHRFKAAVVGAPCINLHSMYGTSDIGVSFGENQWGGSSVGDVDILLKHSPLTYATEVQTPVLLMHGEVDYRCPIEQSEQFFVALKRQGKTVEFVRFPDGAHGFRRNAHPTFREEYPQRMIDWLNRYV